MGKEGTDPEEIDEFVRHVEEKNRYQPEFLQAFHEVFQSVKPALLMNPDYLRAFKVIVEPERSITFRVPWVDDKGKQVSLLPLSLLRLLEKKRENFPNLLLLHSGKSPARTSSFSRRVVTSVQSGQKTEEREEEEKAANLRKKKKKKASKRS